MNKFVVTTLALALFGCNVAAQTTPSAGSTPRPASPIQKRQTPGFDLAEYGVFFDADTRLIIMMTALEAAGLELSSGRDVSTFRAQVRKDLAELDPELRTKLRTFYERNKLPAPATAADQAARYISLALTLGQPPTLDAPERSDELPAGILEVLDFAPLAREFYRRSGMEDRLVTYTRAYQAEGDRLRQPTADMVRSVLTYLHTRPITITLERVVSKAPTSKNKNAQRTYTTREHERRFTVIPDLLATPGAINFRVIGDSYFAIVPPGTDPTSSELRRAYLQYVIDPLTVRFNREIADRREHIKQVTAAREKEGAAITPDIFLIVSRSIVAAADARFEEVRRLEALAAETRLKLNAASGADRANIAKESQAAMNAIREGTIARLADEYERGSVLVFFFADQLKGIESSGFDIANFFPDMIASFDPAREIARPSEYAAIRQKVLAEKQARAGSAPIEESRYTAGEQMKAAMLVKQLSEIEDLLRSKDYTNAEARLKGLFSSYPREPRIFFALAQTANLAAQDATDEEVQADRLKRALANYRLALEASSPETDRALISRAHEAMGRIYAFMENTADAMKEFEEAIKIGEVRGGAYKEALAGKKRLEQP